MRYATTCLLLCLLAPGSAVAGDMTDECQVSVDVEPRNPRQFKDWMSVWKELGDTDLVDQDRPKDNEEAKAILCGESCPEEGPWIIRGDTEYGASMHLLFDHDGKLLVFEGLADEEMLDTCIERDVIRLVSVTPYVHVSVTERSLELLAVHPETHKMCVGDDRTCKTDCYAINRMDSDFFFDGRSPKQILAVSRRKVTGEYGVEIDVGSLTVEGRQVVIKGCGEPRRIDISR